MDTIIEGPGDDLCCVVKLRLPWEGHAKKVLKAVHKIEGVRTTEINSIGHLRVYGDDVDVGTIMQKLKKFVDSSELMNYDNGGGNKDTDDQTFRKGFLKSLFSKKTMTDLGGQAEGFLKSIFKKKKSNTVVLGRYGEGSLKSMSVKKKTKTIVLGDNAVDDRRLLSTDKESK